MNFSKSLIAVSALTFLASCGNEAATEATTSTTQTVTQTATQVATPAPVGTTTAQTITTQDDDIEDIYNGEKLSYNSTVTYNSPEGEDVVRFIMITDKEGTVLSLDANLEQGGEMSQNMTDSFEEEVETKIVGKKIADLGDISAVGGASLTTEAFKKFIADKQ